MAKKLAPVHPGEVLLEEFLEPMGISQYRLAKDIGVPPRRINEIVKGQRAITADTALRLGRDNISYRNLIAGSGQSAVEVYSDGNAIAGNILGLNVTGSAILGNLAEGIYLEASNNTIGGLLAVQRNIISGNGEAGIQLDAIR